MVAYYILGTVVAVLTIVGSFAALAKWIVGRIDNVETRVIDQGERLARIEGKINNGASLPRARRA